VISLPLREREEPFVTINLPGPGLVPPTIEVPPTDGSKFVFGLSENSELMVDGMVFWAPTGCSETKNIAESTAKIIEAFKSLRPYLFNINSSKFF
jgi:hypothetical protein